MLHALIVLRDDALRELLADVVRKEGFSVVEARTGREMERSLEDRPFDLILLDPSEFPFPAPKPVPGRGGRRTRPALVAIRTSEARPARAAPASAFSGPRREIVLPLREEALREVLGGVIREARRWREIREVRLRASEEGFGFLIGRSPAMERVYDLLSRIAPSRASVFITGESGTGKEMVARTIHAFSPRHEARFEAINCGAISPTLIESELFGHEKGSFTGATRRHRGIFERADRGTLFLDEITEMPADLQVRLLRVLETGSFRRIGGETLVRTDVRILTATNVDPVEALREGRIREDVYYRLKGLQVDLPPLRERREDLPLLARAFLREIGEREGRPKRFHPDTLPALREYHWPGNVREFRNAIHTAYLLSDGEEVVSSALPGEVIGVDAEVAAKGSIRVPVGTQVREAERRLILATLAHVDGRKTKAAEILGISLKTLYNRLHAYGVMGRADGERLEPG